MNNIRIILDNKIIDTRSLEEAKKYKINILRIETSQNISEIENIDYMTQLNAAIGIYDSQRTEEIKNKIQFWRNKFLIAKNKILNAQTLEELDNISL